MKQVKYLLTLGAVLALLAFAGCTLQNAPDATSQLADNPIVQETLDNLQDGQGALVFNIPQAKVLDTSWAAQNANAYEIYAYNNDTIISGYALTDYNNTIAIAVPEGDYTVLALAGLLVQSDNPSQGVMLVGSGKQENVSIVAGQVTTVNITLQPVDLQISAPDSVQTGSSFEAVVTGSYGTDVLGDNGFTLRTTFDDPEAISNNFSSPIYPLNDASKTFNSGSNFQRTFDVTAPLNTDNGTNWTIWFCTNQITLNDGKYSNRTLNDDLEWSFVWSNMNPAYRITSFAGIKTYKTITLEQADSLDVNVSW